MPVQMFKEQLAEKYDGVSPKTLLPLGSICDGQNMRKVSAAGGWKPRKGCGAHNTTAIAAASVLSLHQYTHPRNLDYHFLAQCNSNLYDATNDPPTGGTTFGSSLTTLVGTTPGFSTMVGETWFYGDGSGAPVMWGGDTPFCSGFVVYDSSETAHIDYTRVVRDKNSVTKALVLGAAGDVYYVCSPQIASAITLDLGSAVNTNAITATVSSWQNGSWSNRSATDGTVDTATETKTHAKDGSLTWAASASDTMPVIAGIMGYWYKVSFSGALSNSVEVNACTVVYAPARLTNKWNGVYLWPLAVRLFDGTNYVEYSGQLTNESVSQYVQLEGATTSYFLYVKAKEPLSGIGFGVATDFVNTADAQIDSVEYWDGDSWVALTTGLTDETYDGTNSSIAQTGTLWWNAAGLVVKKRTMSFDSVPGYWYRVSWDATLANTAEDIRLFMVTVATFPEDLPTYDGVIEFKGRLFLWGDPEYPNRLRFSAKDAPDCFSGDDSGYTDAFGDMEEIVAAKRFYNELIVWKKNSVWLLEGYSPENFGTLRIADTIGCCAPQTTVVIETGYPTMKSNEPLSVAIWMDTDGVYVLDGRKPRKASYPNVDHYFNTESSSAITATKLDNCQAFADRLNNEYHLLAQDDVELVYNYILDEWYPPFVRTVGGATHYLESGLCFRGTDGRYYNYGGGSAGRIYRLEYDTSDKDADNVDVAIAHKIKTRAISATQKQATTLDFTFRKAWIEAKAVTSPTTKTITTNFYKDLATSATELTSPGAISLANAGYSLVVDGVNTNQGRCKTFQLEFSANTTDLEFEIYSVLYELEAVGEFDS